MIELYNGDCLDIMPQLENNSFDLILCDLPYGTTKCKWDVIIPFDKLWEQYSRLIKEDGAIVLFGKEPFSSQLRVSNLDMYKVLLGSLNDTLNCFNNEFKKSLSISIF